jgi:hypothetical protein
VRPLAIIFQAPWFRGAGSFAVGAEAASVKMGQVDLRSSIHPIALLIWLRGAYAQWEVGAVETFVCLVPVRTDSVWLHDRLSFAADLYLLQGRVRILDCRGKGQQTPFSLTILALGASAEEKALYAKAVQGLWLVRSAANTPAFTSPVSLDKMPRTFGAI